MSQVDINNLAKLSKIALSDEEKRELSKEISSILNFVSKVQELELDLTPKPGVNYNNLREDDNSNADKLSSNEELISAAKNNKNNYILVKKVIKQ